MRWHSAHAKTQLAAGTRGVFERIGPDPDAAAGAVLAMAAGRGPLTRGRCGR